MNRLPDGDCVFCCKNFPCPHQLVSEAPRYWFFVVNIRPHTDLHCLLVLKAEVVDQIGHVEDLGDQRLPDEALRELGVLLRQACRSIMKADATVEKVFIASFGAGDRSKHLHFHLLPKRKDEQVKTVGKPTEDGGGMFFLARKEIVADTFEDILKSTTGCESESLICKIREATKAQVTRNAETLRRKFEWPVGATS